jgi:hypothetical protein
MSTTVNDRTPPRGPTTPADIATHKDTIALFTYKVGVDMDGDDEHFRCEKFGAADQWFRIADRLADIGAATVGPEDTDGIRLSIGDAQTVWYVRDGRYAIVVVLPKRTTLSKSILRMSRRALRSLAAADKMDAVRNKTVADAAVARDLGSLTT